MRLEFLFRSIVIKISLNKKTNKIALSSIFAKFRMDDLDVHAGSSDEDMVQNVKTRATRKKVIFEKVELSSKKIKRAAESTTL